VLTFSEGVHLTRLHGLLTSRALQLSSLKTYSDPNATDEERAQMSAIMLQDSPDSTPEKVSEIIRKVRSEFEGDGNEGMVEIASYNSSKQLVLSGSRAGVLRACEKLEYEQIAARAADLPVL
jgi:malonyl CoA-acyl carrier protein transacylase